MKIREFKLLDTPRDVLFDNDKICWIYGADYGYAEACKDHQEILDALSEAAECLESQINGQGGFAVEEVLDSMRVVLAKYKGE